MGGSAEYPGFRTTAAWSLAEQGRNVTPQPAGPPLVQGQSGQLIIRRFWGREGPTCAPFYQGHVIEVRVLGQAGLHHIFSVGQLLGGRQRGE